MLAERAAPSPSTTPWRLTATREPVLLVRRARSKPPLGAVVPRTGPQTDRLIYYEVARRASGGPSDDRAGDRRPPPRRDAVGPGVWRRSEPEPHDTAAAAPRPYTQASSSAGRGSTPGRGRTSAGTPCIRWPRLEPTRPRAGREGNWTITRRCATTLPSPTASWRHRGPGGASSGPRRSPAFSGYQRATSAAIFRRVTLR